MLIVQGSGLNSSWRILALPFRSIRFLLSEFLVGLVPGKHPPRCLSLQTFPSESELLETHTMVFSVDGFESKICSLLLMCPVSSV